MGVVYGFAGMRERSGELTFRPRLPKDVRRIRFRLLVRGSRLEVDLRPEEARYTLLAGEGLAFHHDGSAIQLTPAEPACEFPLLAGPPAPASVGGLPGRVPAFASRGRRGLAVISRLGRSAPPDCRAKRAINIDFPNGYGMPESRLSGFSPRGVTPQLPASISARALSQG